MRYTAINEKAKQVRARADRLETAAGQAREREIRRDRAQRSKLLSRPELEEPPAGAEQVAEGDARKAFEEAVWEGITDSVITGWGNARQTAAWAKRGGELLAAKAAEAAKVREKLVITFAPDPEEAEETRAARTIELRHAGFAYDHFSECWRHKAGVYAEALVIAQRYGGELRRVEPPAAPVVELERAAE